MRVDALLPAPGETVDLEGDALRGWLADRYALDGAWVRVNLVVALGGQAVGGDGTSESLTGGIDRALLGVLRRSADVVLVGAGTLRAERLAMPRTAQLAIATLRKDFDPAALPQPAADGRRPMLLCPPGTAHAVQRRVGDAAEVVAVDGDPAASPRLLVDALRERGFGRIVCEGGADVAGRLLTAGVVDELDLTTAPMLMDGAGVLRSPGTAGRLAGLLRDETDRLYARWTLPRR
ncbi:dihydrofolate reductase family protein [uncultured Amnibacterium sp.]|uniref:dihydrofolate reductase family protein n=1 Tax=uncultured Amnibacterium sp. TaxID=1631851 RepID=UPI0035C954B5